MLQESFTGSSLSTARDEFKSKVWIRKMCDGSTESVELSKTIRKTIFRSRFQVGTCLRAYLQNGRSLHENGTDLRFFRFDFQNIQNL